MCSHNPIPGNDPALPAAKMKLTTLEKLYRVTGLLQCYRLAQDSGLDAQAMFGAQHFMPNLAIEVAIDLLQEIELDVDQLEMRAAE